MLSITLELAIGKKPQELSQLPIIKSYDPETRVVIFLPKVEPVKYNDLKKEYEAEAKALEAA